MTHAGALAPAIEAMLHEDPACRWDMATSARRLGAIARVGAPAYPPRADPAATRVIGAPLIESTQALSAAVPVAVAAPVAAALVVPRPVVPVPVVSAPVAEVPVARATVVAEAVAVPPAVSKDALEPKPVAAEPVVARVPMAMAPAVKSPVVARSVTPAAAVAKAPVSVGPVPPSHDEGSGLPWKPFVLVALLVGLVTVVFLMSQASHPGAPAATTKPTTSGQPGPQATSAPAVAPKTTEPPPATTSAPTTASAPTGREADKQLAEFVHTYYSDVTHQDKRDQTWTQLTSGMQTTTAGGRAGYESWWRGFESVHVNGTQVNAAAMTGTADLTYTRTNGNELRQTDRFTFVRRGGVWLIDTYNG
jgi:hypothetical protein